MFDTVSYFKSAVVADCLSVCTYMYNIYTEMIVQLALGPGFYQGSEGELKARVRFLRADGLDGKSVTIGGH